VNTIQEQPVKTHSSPP